MALVYVPCSGHIQACSSLKWLSAGAQCTLMKMRWQVTLTHTFLPSCVSLICVTGWKRVTQCPVWVTLIVHKWVFIIFIIKHQYILFIFVWLSQNSTLLNELYTKKVFILFDNQHKIKTKIVGVHGWKTNTGHIWHPKRVHGELTCELPPSLPLKIRR